ncbi:hypothetical protein ACSBR2_001986 [Camellia fascicularis]
MKQLWRRQQCIDIIDIGEGYYLVRFACKADYLHVLLDGPWVILGHYLTVNKWRPDFHPVANELLSTMVWIRFPGVPIEYFNESLLLRLGNLVGRAIKTEKLIADASRGRFARVCAELNLKNALVSKVGINNVEFAVEYEVSRTHRTNSDKMDNPPVTDTGGRRTAGSTNAYSNVQKGKAIVSHSSMGNRFSTLVDNHGTDFLDKVGPTSSLDTTGLGPFSLGCDSNVGPSTGQASRPIPLPFQVHSKKPLPESPRRKIHNPHLQVASHPDRAPNHPNHTLNSSPFNPPTSLQDFPPLRSFMAGGSDTRRESQDEHSLAGQPATLPPIPPTPSLPFDQMIPSVPGRPPDGLPHSNHSFLSHRCDPTDSESCPPYSDEGIVQDRDASYPVLEDDGSVAAVMATQVDQPGGAGNDATFRTICELARSHDPAILVLLETRVTSNKAQRIIRRTRFSDMAVVEATGFAGGIWLFWRNDLVEVDILPPHLQAFSVIIRRKGEVDWLFTALHASPNSISRSELWNYLVDVAHGLPLPWLIAGDFNEISSNSEKQGGAPSTQRRLSRFVQVIDECNLTDLGFSGPKFTWTNSCHGLANIKERLDRALCNDPWHTFFPEAWVQHLPKINSDHCPLLISLIGFVPHLLRRPFRMEAAWLTHPTFETLVQQSWNFTEKDLPLTIDRFVAVTTTWNREAFGNIFWNKKRVLARLHGIQQALSLTSNPFLEQLESHLIIEYNKLLLQEEVLWYQKSRSN